VTSHHRLKHWFIQPLHSCKLALCLAQENQGLVQTANPDEYECRFTPEAWRQEAERIRPFTTHATGPPPFQRQPSFFEDGDQSHGRCGAAVERQRHRHNFEACEGQLAEPDNLLAMTIFFCPAVDVSRRSSGSVHTVLAGQFIERL
jgi:hypothetical protein